MAEKKTTAKSKTAKPTASKAEEVAKPKRRLKATPTLREQASKQAQKAAKPSKVRQFFSSKLFAPIREIGIVFKLVWRSRLFRPFRPIFRFIGRIVAPKYVRNSVKEMRNVTWPGFALSWKLTFAVLAFAISFGLLIAGLDYVFENVFREVILSL